MKIKMSENAEVGEDVEIIFQVRINRDDGSFEYVKKKLEPFEQCGFELFIRNYAELVKIKRLDSMIEEEDIYEDDDEEEREEE